MLNPFAIKKQRLALQEKINTYNLALSRTNKAADNNVTNAISAATYTYGVYRLYKNPVFSNFLSYVPFTNLFSLRIQTARLIKDANAAIDKAQKELAGNPSGTVIRATMERKSAGKEELPRTYASVFKKPAGGASPEDVISNMNRVWHGCRLN